MVVGECGWWADPDPSGTVEIFYALAPPWRGRGLGADAVGNLLTAARGDPRTLRVEADVHVGNLPSRRLLERLGFGLVDVRAHHARYARPL